MEQKKKGVVIGKRHVLKRLREEELISYGCKEIDDAILQLKTKLNLTNSQIIDFVNTIFSAGVKSGFTRALDRIEDGRISVRKIKNEEHWQLFCESHSYTISNEIKIQSKKL
ncbi:hypothetical protein LNO20_16125 [Klebsiella quasipneumoniae subsp. quasipneumoniae]|nr:hypothetical protein [Klebsiella quasipneumoniae subsp. quasipneumoniae]